MADCLELRISKTARQPAAKHAKQALLLKGQPQSKLNLPGRCALSQIADPTYIRGDGGRIRIDGQVRICRRFPVLNVEYIERFHAELKLESLAQGNGLE